MDRNKDYRPPLSFFPLRLLCPLSRLSLGQGYRSRGNNQDPGGLFQDIFPIAYICAGRFLRGRLVRPGRGDCPVRAIRPQGLWRRPHAGSCWHIASLRDFDRLFTEQLGRPGLRGARYRDRAILARRAQESLGRYRLDRPAAGLRGLASLRRDQIPAPVVPGRI